MNKAIFHALKFAKGVILSVTTHKEVVAMRWQMWKLFKNMGTYYLPLIYTF